MYKIWVFCRRKLFFLRIMSTVDSVLRNINGVYNVKIVKGLMKFIK